MTDEMLALANDSKHKTFAGALRATLLFIRLLPRNCFDVGNRQPVTEAEGQTQIKRRRTISGFEPSRIGGPHVPAPEVV